MSGTYQLSQPGGNQSTLELFPDNPLYKTPRFDRLGTAGMGEPIFGAFFTWDFGWESVPRSDALFFESRYEAGGLYYAKLPHPKTGVLTSFTGVVVDNVSYTLGDVERDAWAEALNVSLRVNIGATGGF